MPETAELHDRLLAHARNYDPTAHHRGLLAPYRDVLLIWRAKFMSYEQIAAALGQHGIRVSSAGVGVYCRRTFAKSEIERVRHEDRNSAKPARVAESIPLRPAGTANPRRGPRIARDDY